MLRSIPQCYRFVQGLRQINMTAGASLLIVALELLISITYRKYLLKMKLLPVALGHYPMNIALHIPFQRSCDKILYAPLSHLYKHY
jgi:hypothetical protein